MPLIRKRQKSLKMNDKPKKLLDQVRDAIREKQYSIRTEQAYVNWIKRFILFHGKRHPKEMSSAEIAAFLTHLAVEKNVAASTQNPCTEPAEVRLSAPSSFSTTRCLSWIPAPSPPSAPRDPATCPSS